MRELITPALLALLVFAAGTQSAVAGYMKSDSSGWAKHDHNSFWNSNWINTSDDDATDSKQAGDKSFINTSLPRYKDRQWIGFDFGRDDAKGPNKKRGYHRSKKDRSSDYHHRWTDKGRGRFKDHDRDDDDMGHPLFTDLDWQPRFDWDGDIKITITIDASDLLYLFLAIKHDIKHDKDYGWFFDLIKQWKMDNLDRICAKFGDKYPKCDDNMPPVPVPAAVWLFASGLLGLGALARRKLNQNT